MTLESRESIKVSGPELIDKSDVLLFDVDGVLSFTAKISVDKLKNFLVQRLGRDVNLDFNVAQIEEYGQMTKWALERNFKEDEAGTLEGELWDSIDTLSRAEPTDGARELLSWLVDEKKKSVKAHTSRPCMAKNITEEFLYKVSGGRGLPLSIRLSDDADRHMFKAINATNEAAKYGRVLAFEDIPSHASNILNFADKQHQDVWVLLMPFARLPVSSELLSHPRLICVERKSEEIQSIRRIHKYLKGESY